MIPKDVRVRYDKLKAAIDRYRLAFHVYDREEISAEALDSLKRELTDIEKIYPAIISPDSPSQRVAGAPLPEFKKVKHTIPQWSLNDAFSPDDIREFDARVKRFLAAKFADAKPTYLNELKIDGLKIVLTYKKGLLTTAATRGNGVVGEDVTHNVRTIESVPLSLTRKIDVVVEGEVWMSSSALASLNRARAKEGESPFANPRNAAAGSIRQLDPKVAAARKLDTFIYELAATSEKFPDDQKTELGYLRELGFKVNPHFAMAHDADDIIKFWEEWKEKGRRQDYWVDGIVAKVNERIYEDALGYTGKGPRFAVAFKFPAQQVTTVVEDIVLQVGRTGVLTPVAHLRSVAVAGTIVSRATLHNEDEIRRLDVRIGDTVVLKKAGDVIPDIVKVLKELRTGKEKEFKWPKRVAACGGDGSIERIPGESAWRCVDRDSDELVKRRVRHFASRAALDIEGMGKETAALLVEEGFVNTFDELFTLTEGDLQELEGFAELSAKNLIESISKARCVTLSRLLYGLSIDHVGEETARLLSLNFKTLAQLRKASVEKIAAIKGIGDVIAGTLTAWFAKKENIQMLEKLLKQVTVIADDIPTQGALTGKTFVLTGTLEGFSREEAQMRIREKGGGISSSVSRRTSYVVAGADPGSKLDKAKHLGVKVISGDELIKMLK